MQAADYQPPVSQLISYGMPKNDRGDQWFDYVEAFGLTDKHIPDLIRLATDEGYNWQDEGESCGPIHAYRALGQLKAEKAIQPLIRLLDDEENEWFMIDLPKVFGMIGSACIPALADYLNNDEHSCWSKVAAAKGLTKVAELDPAHRDESVEIITEALSRHQQHLPEFNGSLVSELIDLRAIESVSEIERAYKEGPMEEMFCGSWARVQIELGLARAEDFSPDELRHKEPEWMQNIRNLTEGITGLTQIENGISLTTNIKAVSDKSRLQLFGKGGQAVKKSKSTQPKAGFGSERPQEKKRKKKR